MKIALFVYYFFSEHFYGAETYATESGKEPTRRGLPSTKDVATL